MNIAVKMYISNIVYHDFSRVRGASDIIQYFNQSASLRLRLKARRVKSCYTAVPDSSFDVQSRQKLSSKMRTDNDGDAAAYRTDYRSLLEQSSSKRSAKDSSSRSIYDSSRRHMAAGEPAGGEEWTSSTDEGKTECHLRLAA